jgi:acetylornithine deacetylase/succinyl-diaminopimelate desuccinylase-like protein
MPQDDPSSRPGGTDRQADPLPVRHAGGRRGDRASGRTVLSARRGSTCTRVDRGGIANLYARWGKAGANKAFGFNGHTDVVPVGDAEAWTHDPFGAEIR